LEAHAHKRFFEKDCRVGKEIKLKTDAQVMLLYNLDLPNKLANGSRGIVLCCVPVSHYRHLLVMELTSRGMDVTSTEKENEGDDRKVNKTEEGTEINMAPNYLEMLGKDKRPTTAGLSNNASVDSCNKISSMDIKATSSTESLVPNLEPDLTIIVVKELQKMSTEQLQKEEEKVSVAESYNLKEFPIVRFREGQVRVITFQNFDKEFKGCGTASRWQIPLTLA